MEIILRLWAIVRTDALLRLRRTSTLVLMLITGLFAYSMVPDPASGQGLFVINGARTLYNSASISFATSMLCSILGIGLFGFYMVSNSIRRDVDSHVGGILAATPMRSWEYLFGKFLGNVAFLSVLMLVFMLAMMGMYALRGEAPFELLVFVRTYAVMCASATVFVAVVALVFESLPVFSGRVGDVVYFVLWVAALAVPIVQLEGKMAAERMRNGVAALPLSFTDIPWAAYIDVFGMGAGMMSVNAQMQAVSNGFSIGSSPFDPHLAPIVLREITLPGDWWLVKILSLLAMTSVLSLAYIAFHRFDPTRVKATVRQSRKNIFSAINLALKPINTATMAAWNAVLPRIGGNSVVAAVLGELFVLIAQKPLALVCIIALNASSFLMPLDSVQAKLLPIASVVFVITCSSIALRERQRGTTGLIWSLPAMKPHFVWIKLIAAYLLALALVAVPFVRLVVDSPSTGLSLLVGMLFLSAAAVALGTVSGTAKVFVVSALLLFYLCLNMGANIPAMDFAGWHGTADASVQAGYCAGAALLLALGYVVHRIRAEG